MSTDDNAARGEPYLTNIENAVDRMDKTLDNIEEGVEDVNHNLGEMNSLSRGSLRWEIRKETRKTRLLLILLSVALAVEVILLSVYF